MSSSSTFIQLFLTLIKSSLNKQLGEISRERAAKASKLARCSTNQSLSLASVREKHLLSLDTNAPQHSSNDFTRVVPSTKIENSKLIKLVKNIL